MPTPAADTRFVILTHTERLNIEAAADICGGPKPFCSQAGVRAVETYWRAVGRGPVLPYVAAALIATADRVRGGAPPISTEASPQHAA